MLSLFGPEESIKNVFLLANKYVDSTNKVANTKALKPYYLSFLSDHQPQQPINRSNSLFITDSQIERKLKALYIHENLANENEREQQAFLGEEALQDDEKDVLMQLVQSGYTYLTQSHRDVKALFDLVIHTIFFKKSRKIEGYHALGGSSSTAIGTIWISGYGGLEGSDFAELLLHELIHHLLFVDERCHGHFHSALLSNPEHFAKSALLKRRRPLDKVVHSIVVATEILLARRSFMPQEKTRAHAHTQELIKSTLSSIEEVKSMVNIDDLVSPRIQMILDSAYRALKEADHAKVASVC